MINLSRKIFALLLAENFDESDFWHQIACLKQVKSEVVVAGEAEGKVYKGKGGMTAIAEKDINELDPHNLDGVIILGGFRPNYLRRSGESNDLIRTMHDQGKLVGFIYHGSWMPVSCGILKGKRSESIKITLAYSSA